MKDQEIAEARRIAYLVSQQIEGKLNEAESKELENWRNDNRANAALYDKMMNAAHREQVLAGWTADNTNAALKLVESRIAKQAWMRWLTVAAAMLVLASVSFIIMNGYFFLKEEPGPAITMTPKIKPGSMTATLTLGNGRRILLTGLPNGKIAEDAGAVITKSADGQLLYRAKADEGRAVLNTLTTTKGQQYKVTLPDGSGVWLNAGSALTYPSQFPTTGGRRVTLSGEAYFEITKDRYHPFVVQTSTQEVEVLGTHFNINSYADEPAVRTTLIEGIVRVQTINPGRPRLEKILKPDQQAVLKEGSFQVKEVHGSDVASWKDGRFQFDREDVGTIMRKVARWYDVAIKYANDSDKIKFTGTVSRYEDIQVLLSMLESTGELHFTTKGRTILVSRKIN